MKEPNAEKRGGNECESLKKVNKKCGINKSKKKNRNSKYQKNTHTRKPKHHLQDAVRDKGYVTTVNNIQKLSSNKDVNTTKHNTTMSVEFQCCS